jgi:hypothetical protein
MTRQLPLENWQVHMAVWGYDTWGALDGIAFMAECPGARTIRGKVWWDRTVGEVAGEWISDGDGWHRVPDHWALPAVTDLRMLEATR